MRKKFQAKPAAIIVALTAFLILIALGTWQVQRLGEKTILLNKISQRMAADSTPMPEYIENPKDWEYRRVALAGSFDFSHEFLIKPRTLNGANGYHMFVPFKRISGGIIMVNRGWISDKLMAKDNRTSRIIRIEGVIQIPHKTMFTPKNNPAKNDWYWPDLKSMAANANLKNVAPVIVTLTKRVKDLYPAGIKVTANIRNNHKAYAAFWYSMSLILVVIFILSNLKQQENSKVKEVKENKDESL